MSERSKYLNSYYAPVIRWEKKWVDPSSDAFTLDTSHMQLLSLTKGLQAYRYLFIYCLGQTIFYSSASIRMEKESKPTSD